MPGHRLQERESAIHQRLHFKRVPPGGFKPPPPSPIGLWGNGGRTALPLQCLRGTTGFERHRQRSLTTLAGFVDHCSLTTSRYEGCKRTLISITQKQIFETAENLNVEAAAIGSIS